MTQQYADYLSRQLNEGGTKREIEESPFAGKGHWDKMKFPTPGVKDMGATKQQTGLDPVDKKELKGKHADREDPDIDNDGDVDTSDKYLHNRRKKVSKEVQKKQRRAAAIDGVIKSITQSAELYEPEGEDLEEWEYGKKFVKDPGGETEKLIGKTAEWSGQNVGKAVKFGKGIAKKFISGYKKASAEKDKKKYSGTKIKPGKKNDGGGSFPSDFRFERDAASAPKKKYSGAKINQHESIEDSYDAARGAEESYCRYYDGTIIDETMSVHLKPHRNGTHYVVHKVGSKLKRHGGLKVGEKISDTEVDDLGDVGVKVKHMNEEVIMYGVMEGIKVMPREPKKKKPKNIPGTDATINPDGSVNTEYDPSEDMEGIEMTEETAANKYADYISRQIVAKDPLNPLNSVDEVVYFRPADEDPASPAARKARGEKTPAKDPDPVDEPGSPNTGEKNSWAVQQGRSGKKKATATPMAADEAKPRRTTRGGTPAPTRPSKPKPSMARTPKKGRAPLSKPDIQDSANAADKYAAFISNQISAAGPSNQREYEYHPAEFVDESSVESYGIHQDVVKHMEKDGKDPNHAGDYGTYSDHHHMKRGFTHKQYGGHGSFSYSKGPGAGQKLESDPGVAKTDPS